MYQCPDVGGLRSVSLSCREAQLWRLVEVVWAAMHCQGSICQYECYSLKLLLLESKAGRSDSVAQMRDLSLSKHRGLIRKISPRQKSCWHLRLQLQLLSATKTEFACRIVIAFLHKETGLRGPSWDFLYGRAMEPEASLWDHYKIGSIHTFAIMYKLPWT